MMKNNILRALLFATFLAHASTAHADTPDIQYQPDPDSPIGTRNPAAPDETAQYDFLIGDWDVAITWFPNQGEPTSYNARWHNHWINDGFDVMQEWRGPYITGSEFRHFDKTAGHWVGMNLYVGGKWVKTTARQENENMVVIIEASNPRDGDFLNRETYHSITENRWQMRSERSYDGGTTWVKGHYEMIASRLGNLNGPSIELTEE